MRQMLKGRGFTFLIWDLLYGPYITWYEKEDTCFHPSEKAALKKDNGVAHWQTGSNNGIGKL